MARAILICIWRRSKRVFSAIANNLNELRKFKPDQNLWVSAIVAVLGWWLSQSALQISQADITAARDQYDRSERVLMAAGKLAATLFPVMPETPGPADLLNNKNARINEFEEIYWSDYAQISQSNVQSCFYEINKFIYRAESGFGTYAGRDGLSEFGNYIHKAATRIRNNYYDTIHQTLPIIGPWLLARKHDPVQRCD